MMTSEAKAENPAAAHLEEEDYRLFVVPLPGLGPKGATAYSVTAHCIGSETKDWTGASMSAAELSEAFSRSPKLIEVGIESVFFLDPNAYFGVYGQSIQLTAHDLRILGLHPDIMPPL